MEWLVCMAIGAALWLAIPAVRQAEHRRIEPHPMVAPIAAAMRIPASDPGLEALVEAADAALEADALSRGLRGVGDAYRHAAGPTRNANMKDMP